MTTKSQRFLKLLNDISIQTGASLGDCYQDDDGVNHYEIVETQDEPDAALVVETDYGHYLVARRNPNDKEPPCEP